MYRVFCWPSALLAALVLALGVSRSLSCPRSCNCYQTNEVHCTFRSLLTVPPGLPTQTRRINLGFNSIRKLQENSLSELRRVELLMLHSNDLHHLPDDVFRDMNSLQILKLSYNKLREISSSLTFSGLTSLLRLYLDHNLLQHIHPRALLQLPSLRLLRLQGNRLHQLHPHTLCTLSLLNTYYFSTLRHLDLSNNSLTTLPKDSLATAPLLETLILHSNPWSCDCRLKWFLPWSLAHPGIMKCPNGPQCPVCALPTSLQGQGLLDQPAMLCSSPVIHSPGKETFLEPEPSEIQSSETFREPFGSISLGLSDQQGTSVDLSCNITHSSDSQELNLLPDQSVTLSSPLSLALSVTLECFIGEQSYEKLWRILAYYSQTAAQLEREIMLSKAPELAYRYKQGAETTGYYHTGIKASVKAKPHWLLQSAIGIQLNRAQSSRHKVQLIYSTKVSAPPDLIADNSGSSITFHPWVLISSNNSFTSYVATPQSNVELSCPILSSGNPKVWWILPDGSKISASFNNVDGRLQVTASGLFLQKVQLSDAGIYYCVAEARRDVDVLPLRLAVEESSVPHSGELVGPPVIATVGKNASLSCKMSGSPQPEISWILPDGNILRRGLAISRGLMIQSNGSLSLLNPSPRDVGHYRCIGVNQYGSDSLSFPLKLNPQHIMPFEMLFPKGPQSASGRSTKIRAPLFHQAGEGSGEDVEQDEPRGTTNNKQRTVLSELHPQRRYQGEKVEQRGPLREGPLRKRPVSPSERRRHRFQNRNRGSTNRLRLDPQKWADLLAKIRQKTANISSSQLTNGNPTAEPKQRNEDGGGIRDRTQNIGTEAETEGSSEDDVDKMSQPVQFPHADPQIKTEIKSHAGADTDVEMPTGKQLHTKTEANTHTHTEKVNPVTKTPSIPLKKNETLLPDSNSGAKEIALETKDGPKQGLYPMPGSSWTRHRLPPNLVQNSRNQSHWNLQRKPGKRRRIGRPRSRLGTPPQSLPDLMRPRPQAVLPDSMTNPTNLLQTVPTNTFMPVLLTTDQIDASTNDPSLNYQSFSPTGTSILPTSDSTAPPLTTFIINRSTFTDPVTQSSKTSQSKESTLNNKPTSTQSKTVISEKRLPDTHDATFTHGILPHPETKSASAKSTEIPVSTHSKNLEGDILDKSHFSTTHSFYAFSVPKESSDLPTARTIMRNTSTPPKRASYDGSTSGSLTNENTLSISHRTTTKSPFLSASTNIVTPTTTFAIDALSSDTPTITSTTASTSVTSTTLPFFTISTTEASSSTLKPLEETFSTTSVPGNSKKDATVLYEIKPGSSTSFTTSSKKMTTIISATTSPLVVKSMPLNTIKFTQTEFFSTTITMTTSSPRSPSRQLDEVDPRASPASVAPVRSQHPTDWKNSGANSIPDSHNSRSPHPTAALHPAAPVAPAVSSRPKIADPHTRQVSFPAESIALLACEAEGQPKPSITWTKVATGAMVSIHSRGERFEVLPNGTLVIKNVQPRDRGTYICSANNFLGRDRLLTTLEVWTRPPRMRLGSYREVTIHQGGEVHLECQADGVPSPLLSWVLPDRSTLTPGTRSDRIIMNTNATLFISATLPSDRGVYRCVASNSAGAASASVRVHVSSLPPVIQQPRKEHLLLPPGMPVFAHCFARGAPPPTLRWRIPNGTLVRPSQFLPGNLFVLPNGTLHIRSVESRDMGDYECIASNAMGSAKRTVTVEVKGGTDEKIPNENTKEAISENISLSSKKGVLPIPSSPSDALSSFKSSSLHPTNSSSNLLLPTSPWNIFSNSSSKFNKTFIASPTNFTNFRKTNHSFLSPSSTVPTNKTNISPNINTTRVLSSLPVVGKAPLHPLPVSPFTKARIVSTSPPTSSLPYGGVLQLHCTTTGNPIPVIIWRTPSRKLIDMNYSFDRRLKVHPNGTLSVQAVRQSDAGDYLCIARNKVADDYRLLRVAVATKPAKIEPKQPLSHMVLYGKPLKVDCQAYGLPDPVVQWSLPDGTMVNSVLNGEGRGLRSRRLTVFDNGTLLVPAVGIKEEGEYTCYAENQEGQDTMKVKVKVTMTSPPTFTEDRKPSIVKVRQGATVTIPCLASGNPIPKVMWFSPTHRAIPQSLGSRFYSGRAVVGSDGTLQIRLAQKSDSGNYTCRAINSVGERTKVVSLDVEVPIYGLYGQTGERGRSINQHGTTYAIRPGDSIDNPRITGHRSISNKLQNNNNSNSNNFGRTRNMSTNNGVNLSISGSYPTIKSDSQREIHRLTSGGNTGTRFGVNTAQNVGIKEENTGIKSSGSVRSSSTSANSHATIRAQTGELKPETINNELVAERTDSDGSTSRDRGRLNDISRNVGNFRVSFSSEKADPKTFRGNDFSRNSELIGINDDNRKDGLSGHTETVVGVVTTTKKQAVKGQTVLLPCPYRGGTPLRQAWLLPGNGMLPAPFYGSRLIVHRNGSLEIRGVQVGDSGTFVCVVKTEGGEAVFRVELGISQSQVEFRSVQSGVVQGKTQTKSLNSAPPPLSPLYLQRRVNSHVVPQPVNSPPVFAPVSEPKISYRTSPLVSIISGETLRLKCPASSGQALLSWTTPTGKVLSRGDRDDSGRFILQEDRTLIVNQASVFDRGTYTCRSSTNDSSSVSVVTLPVIVIAYPPRITKGPAPMTYTHIGVAVELPCLTIATPRATVTWETPDLTQLRMMGQPRIYGNNYLSPQGSLVIQNPTHKDTGFYKCTATNVIGTDSKATYLHVI